MRDIYASYLRVKRVLLWRKLLLLICYLCLYVAQDELVEINLRNPN